MVCIQEDKTNRIWFCKDLHIGQLQYITYYTYLFAKDSVVLAQFCKIFTWKLWTEIFQKQVSLANDLHIQVFNKTANKISITVLQNRFYLKKWCILPRFVDFFDREIFAWSLESMFRVDCFKCFDCFWTIVIKHFQNFATFWDNCLFSIHRCRTVPSICGKMAF